MHPKSHNKKYQKEPSPSSLKSFFIRTIFQILICVVLFLFGMIIVTKHPKIKGKIYHYLYERNLNFASVRNWYQTYIASYLPFKTDKESIKVFKEDLNYRESSIYKDGVSLLLEGDLVPILESGVVIFKGEKKDYGKTIIIQQIDGTNVWYGNLSNLNVDLYDYVTKGEYLAEVNDKTLYLVFEKDGIYVDYKEYIS